MSQPGKKGENSPFTHCRAGVRGQVLECQTPVEVGDQGRWVRDGSRVGGSGAGTLVKGQP